ncbi:transcriptional regulator [Saccharomonospora marina XMU15]|uniref:Transcriptional regulator n=1 Tax=Saccharomonospora marina XMU15 TaxID=882083 RepID=H5X7M3_9PSEU|nr:TetR/AcrR family transcriptional regulator [Saccharomonospora marina]EHR51315.1 transcriptional regulator [Saccharomonospora marina XMU15]
MPRPDQAEPARSAPGRERILAAAETLFAEHGFDRTSTARLAEAAGVPQSLIFYHFGTKWNLLLSLISERSTQTMADLVAPEPPGEARAAIAGLWSSLCRHLGRRTPLHRIVQRESDTHPQLRQHALRSYDDLTATVAGFLARVTGHDGDPSQELWAAARMLVATSAAAATTHGDDGSALAPDTVANLLADGLLGPPR